MRSRPLPRIYAYAPLPPIIPRKHFRVHRAYPRTGETFDRWCHRRRRRRRCTRFPRRRAANTDVPQTRRGGRRTESASAAPAAAHAPRAVNYSPFFLFFSFFFFSRVYSVALSLSRRSYPPPPPPRTTIIVTRLTRRNASPLPFPFRAFFIFLRPGAFLSVLELRSPSCRFARNVNNNYNSPPFRLPADGHKEEEGRRRRK